jgi:hypothetical protein
MSGAWNLFAIGRRRRNEDQLTEMLVWLIDAVPDVGKALLALAFDDAVLDGELNVTTQHGIAKGRLDALLVGPTFALVVESKIDSGLGEDQIDRYLAWLAATHAHREHRGLMTLTAHPISWDIEKAGEIRVRGSAHLWEELHDLIEPLALAPDREPLESRLIEEFLEMIGEEGLIPMKPLGVAELGAWRPASETVSRFHDYFRECKSAIGVALGATPSSNAKSDHQGYTWQDYVYSDGCKIVVGLQDSDHHRAPRSAERGLPLVWMAVEASHWPHWGAVKDRLESSPPAGWTAWTRWWGERPQIYRYLDEVLGEGTFEEQRKRLAEACSVGTAWLRDAGAAVGGGSETQAE